MRHYTYKIVNKINNHYYYGRRSYEGEVIEQDTYYGSGKRLKLAFKKYGIENFSKIILQEYETYEELVDAEKKLISEFEVNDVDCYNLSYGGHGGYTYYADRVYKASDESKLKISKANTGRKRPDLVIRHKNDTSWTHYWDGKKRSDSDKASKSIAAKNNMITGANAFAQQLICPHCSKEGSKPNMIRWHFDNCKDKI